MGASEYATQYKAKRPKSRLIKTSHARTRGRTEEPIVLFNQESKFKENALIHLPFTGVNKPSDIGTTLVNSSMDGDEVGFHV